MFSYLHNAQKQPSTPQEVNQELLSTVGISIKPLSLCGYMRWLLAATHHRIACDSACLLFYLLTHSALLAVILFYSILFTYYRFKSYGQYVRKLPQCQYKAKVHFRNLANSINKQLSNSMNKQLSNSINKQRCIIQFQIYFLQERQALTVVI